MALGIVDCHKSAAVVAMALAGQKAFREPDRLV